MCPSDASPMDSDVEEESEQGSEDGSAEEAEEEQEAEPCAAGPPACAQAWACCWWYWGIVQAAVSSSTHSTRLTHKQVILANLSAHTDVFYCVHIAIHFQRKYLYFGTNTHAIRTQ